MSQKNKDSNLIEKLLSVGAHFGYIKSRRHPSVKPFIFGNKNKIEILDLEKTQTLLTNAKDFARGLGAKNATILFLGGKNESQEAIKRGATSIGMPYVVGRWIGGTFTNFPEIRRRADKLNAQKEQMEKGEFSKYTKWERAQIEKEIEKLEIFFGGIAKMKKLPDAIFLIDSKREEIAVKEARMKHIPIMAVMGTDCDLADVAYPILGNDSSRRSIEMFVQEIVQSYKEGLSSAPKKEDK